MNDALLNALWSEINQTHSLYIESEKNVAKLGYKKKLEDLIEQFLNVVPDSFKFHFKETAHILKSSILFNKENTGLYKIAHAWIAITKYANNLLAQPWRKEFVCIKTYSGFYKHQIDRVLSKGEIMLELMGYKPTDQGEMILYDPIDEEQVRAVALDALIAMVECQIIGAIYESVYKQIGYCNIEDVTQLRKTCTGSTNFMIKKLLIQYFQRQGHLNQSQSHLSQSQGHLNYVTPSCSSYPQYNGYGSSIPNGPLPGCIPPQLIHTTSTTCPMNMPQGEGGGGGVNAGYYCHNNYDHNNYGHNNYGHNTMPGNYNWSMPTGNLIDFDHHPSAYNRATTSDSYSRSLSSSDEHHRNHSEGSIRYKNRSKEDLNGSWSYVLDKLEKPCSSSVSSHNNSSTNTRRHNRDTESINIVEDALKNMKLNDEIDGTHTINKNKNDKNYISDKENGSRINNNKEIEREPTTTTISRKDLIMKLVTNHKENSDRKTINRDSIVHPTDKYNESRKTINNTIIIHPNNKYNETLIDYTIIEPIINTSNVHVQTINNDNNNIIQSQPSPPHSSPHLLSISPQHPSTSSTLELTGLHVNLIPEVVDKKDKDIVIKTKNIIIWNCEFCTYKNETIKEICEMCSKSKNKGDESKPLESGGRQCPECTLVNEKGVQNCVACETDLKNSPTYI